MPKRMVANFAAVHTVMGAFSFSPSDVVTKDKKFK